MKHYNSLKNIYPVESVSVASVTVHILETDGTFWCMCSAPPPFTSLPLYTNANKFLSKLFSTDLGLKPKHLFTLRTLCAPKLTHRQPPFNTATNNVSLTTTRILGPNMKLMLPRLWAVLTSNRRFSVVKLSGKVKVKWSRYRPRVAQMVGRGIALLFHDGGTRRGWVVSSTPRPHFNPGKDPVPIVQEAGWLATAGLDKRKSRPHRDSIPDRPARSQSLYRPSYQAHKLSCILIKSYARSAPFTVILPYIIIFRHVTQGWMRTAC